MYLSTVDADTNILDTDTVLTGELTLTLTYLILMVYFSTVDANSNVHCDTAKKHMGGTEREESG